ncbi:amidase family protein [Virgibacillus sp. SK37]|uniref:amidase family protein n=1 Tax=Virgibacillus sp. SK37 TaxID=403957 RepID=UPI0005956D89|nr:amidase family protein [Virgibacillus sp. SK37]
MSKPTFNILESTITEIQYAIQQESLTSKELTLLYMEQIANFNHAGPNINAVLEINPEALHIAEALDMERKQKGVRSPLHGIPILLKDNIDTGDKMHTTAGSIALSNHYAKEDAFLVKKLREAGVVILGKTNLTEWANFMTEDMPNGYSSHGGQVLNPYGPGKIDVGGSSSGSGAAIAANFALGAIGTETSGSILSPASLNSIVGIKPTVGLISRTGIIPISNSQDTAGPMTRTVEDAALLLGAIMGTDAADPSIGMAEGQTTNYTSFLNLDGLANKRIGLPINYFNKMDKEEKQLCQHAIHVMKDLGAIIIEVEELPLELPESTVMFHEFKNGVNAYLARSSSVSSVSSLTDIIHYNQVHKKEALKYGQTVLLEADMKSGLMTEKEYLQHRINDIRLCQKEGIDKVLESNQLDALLFMNTDGCQIAAKAGYPSITVPAGYTTKGKPSGITFTGTAFSEANLIQLAYAYEQATLHRRTPHLEAE